MMGKCVVEGGTQYQPWYWVRDKKNTIRDDHAPLVVLLTWMFSKRRYHMPYVHMFNGFGSECFVVQPHYLNLWFPDRAAALAIQVLDEIAEELQKRPRPVCFVSFSGGTKSCTYIIIQILQGKFEGLGCDVGKYNIVRKCLAGFIFDSTPINFVSETGVLFVKRMLGSTMGGNFAVKLILEAIAKALNSMYASDWQAQEAQLLSAFHAAVEMAPTLFLCSKNDKLAPFEEMEKFYSQVQGNGNVTLCAWEESDHVAHLRHHPREYKEAVSKFWVQMLHTSTDSGDGLSSDTTASKEHMVRVHDVSHMLADDVYDLQHDCKSDFINKRVMLTFPLMRSRL